MEECVDDCQNKHYLPELKNGTPSPYSSKVSNEDFEDNRVDARRFWEIWKKKEAAAEINTHHNIAPTHIDSFDYNMQHPNRGYCIVLNHKTFLPSREEELPDRKGTEIDCQRSVETFRNLGFNVQVFEDLEHKKIVQILEEIASTDHTDNDCLVIIVMTHGKLDRLHAYDISYSTNTLWYYFTPDKCPSLAGKPKMFFIQACRGEEYDDGVVMRSRRARTEVDGPGAQDVYFKIPKQADFITVYSTAPGFYSWRNSKSGSCFVQSLCAILNKHAHELDLLTMMTFVNRTVAIGYESNVPKSPPQHAKKQIPHVSHTLMRQVYFGKKSLGTLV